MDHKSKLCAVPWHELYITSNGHYGLCCLEDQNFNSQRISIDQPVDAHWNSNYMKQVRLDFLQGKSLPQCNQCWNDESANKISGRMRRNLKYYRQTEIHQNDEVFQDTISKTDATGHTSMPIKGLFFSVGDICQLRCIDCSPGYSRSILKDYQKLGWHSNFKNRRFVLKNDLMHDTKEHQQHLWNRVQEIGGKVDWIRVQGGEPTISPQLLKFLHWYNEQGYASETTIMITTNAVNIRQQFLDALKPFRQVKIEISVDGVGELDEYLRYPTNWQKKEKIIDNLISQFDCNIHSTVYSLSIDGLVDLIKWAETKSILHSLQILNYPDELGIQHLPDKFKHKLISELEPYRPTQEYKLDDKFDHQQYRNNCVQGIINRLMECRDEQKWQQAKHTVQAYDSIRHQKLTQILPRLGTYLQQ
jgi:molybdenum cofactor biosynthesis enzyme MoaA